MKTTLYYITIIAAITIGCQQKNNDLTRPKIESFDLLKDTVVVGSNFSISSLISDNLGVASCKINVFPDFGFEADSNEDTDRLNFINVKTFEPPVFTYLVNQRISVPGITSAGPYKISLEVADENGNAANKKTKSIEVLNPADQPTIALSFPSQDTTFSGGDTLALQGSIADNALVKSATFQLKNLDGYTNTLRVDSIYVNSWNLATDGMIKLPFASNTGAFSLIINVQDTSGNLKRITRNFTKN